ncbi:hypothetical protein [Arthrobacter sp. AL12]|uniref:hypothetical protein n=1 Tax=Arthrobacter sp. AL12 TaxID=3042241 RepID=UPI00249A9E4D|nr:hypothetical protein [Arthrobacter sp. AL12]MDI3213550.1 hypothetical protein [Arthrobacter sp. AL12]
MATETRFTTRSPLAAVCLFLVGLLILWMAQPILPSWGCAVSFSAMCPPHLLPVRASLISAGILFVLLAALIVGIVLLPRAKGWTDGLARSAVFVVPVVLILTVVAHFLIPQP